MPIATSPVSDPRRSTLTEFPTGWNGRSRVLGARGSRPSVSRVSDVHAERFVIGSILLFRAEALNQVGGLDDRFFLYAEETDWAYRATLLGWRHLVVDGISAVHLGGATSADPGRREVHFHASQEHFIRKHWGSWGWQVARTGQVVGATLRWGLLSGERAHAARRRLELYLAGPARVERAAHPRDASHTGGRGVIAERLHRPRHRRGMVPGHRDRAPHHLGGRRRDPVETGTCPGGERGCARTGSDCGPASCDSVGQPGRPHRRTARRVIGRPDLALSDAALFVAFWPALVFARRGYSQRCEFSCGWSWSSSCRRLSP